MTTTKLRTQLVTPDGDVPFDIYHGREAVYRAYDGTKMVGTIERFDGSNRAIIRFDDGRWAFSDYQLELVVRP